MITWIIGIQIYSQYFFNGHVPFRLLVALGVSSNKWEGLFDQNGIMGYIITFKSYIFLQEKIHFFYD